VVRVGDQVVVSKKNEERTRFCKFVLTARALTSGDWNQS
jgi:hypothetical protein